MTDEQWQTAWKLYQSGNSVPTEEIHSFLKATTGDAEVREAVLAMFEGTNKAESPDRIGQKVGRYVLTGRLGEGGMGEVYAARDSELGRFVAVKFLAESAVGTSSVERFIREAKAASALNHPNIVTIYEVIHTTSRLAIVMELVDGMSLRQLCGSPLPVDRVLYMGEQVARALGIAHARGIVHCDIKPENLMVRPDGFVKLLDFGLAQDLSSMASNSILPAGTLRYMSPEQSRGAAASTAGDVFSLGIVLYEISTGVHPFESGSLFDGLKALNEMAPLPPSSRNAFVPPQMDSLILRMLAKEPSQRPLAAEVARILESRFANQAVGVSVADRSNNPIPAPPAGAPPQTIDQSKLKPARLSQTMMFATILLALVGGAAWLTFRKELPRRTVDLEARPVTAQSGWERWPTFSPDGQMIAFTWTEAKKQQAQIFVKRFADDNPIQITDSKESGNIGSLSWSPDGKRIAFKRLYGVSGAICTVPSSGGEETRLLDLKAADLSSGVDWSPDGNDLAFGDLQPDTTRNAIYVYNVLSGEKRRLTEPPDGIWGDWDPKFSPDGRRLAFKRVTGFWSDDLYVVASAGGSPTRLPSNKRGISGHDWMPDGNSLIASCQRGGTIYALWQWPLKEGGPQQRITYGGLDAITPVVSRKTGRVAWVNKFDDQNVYRVSMQGGALERVAASSAMDGGASYAPNGRIAFVSDRSNSREIWIAGADGSMPVRVTNFNGAALGSPEWAPDGRRLAFQVQAGGERGIYILRCDLNTPRCEEPQRLTSGRSSDYGPTWSADGKFIYFAFKGGGPWNIWKQSADGGPVEQVTYNRGFLARESSDGQWMYFSRPDKLEVWRKPAHNLGSSSKEELILGAPYAAHAATWTIHGDEVIFFDIAKENAVAAIRAYDIRTHRARTILQAAEISIEDRLSVSPDGKWVLCSRLDRSGSNIMISDDLR
jgi:serine/threonine protein kinase